MKFLAEKEFLQVIDYYEESKPNLGYEFATEVYQTVGTHCIKMQEDALQIDFPRVLYTTKKKTL